MRNLIPEEDGSQVETKPLTFDLGEKKGPKSAVTYRPDDRDSPPVKGDETKQPKMLLCRGTRFVYRYVFFGSLENKGRLSIKLRIFWMWDDYHTADVEIPLPAKSQQRM
ncbi:hypothetical protein RRG08_024079 [Elysia crispata]|uniref:Uncharacterized protein n=1 Tax=Elysia crispata TaxID=231223 RepID=A0AAE0ZP12_9GAST|nr:hypothetical protein RRG08_024079 [Elysia crispata]